MEHIEKQWNMFVTPVVDTPNTNTHLAHTHLDRIQLYKEIQNNCKTAYTHWCSKHQQYQHILSKDTQPATKATTKDKCNVHRLCTEYTALQASVEASLASCSTEKDLDAIMQLWGKLDAIHSVLLSGIQQ